jgi:F-box protein 21
MAGIHELPDEILHYIMRSGPACSAIALEQTSMRFRNVANAPLLWRYFCQNDFRFWDPRHNIREKFSRPASTVAWKDLYKTRRRVDRTTTGLLNSVLASQTGRIQKAHRIVGFGYDVKDTLLRHAAADSDEPDYLARR